MLNKSRKKLAVLISGRGSNMEAILEATKQPEYPAEIAVVISDNAEAKGLETAKVENIAALAFPRPDYSSKRDHEDAIIAAIYEADADFIILAGYMRILTSDFVEAFDGKLINIHPSLLPEFKGLDTHERAISEGATEHGCTVHFVNAEMDGGKIISQMALQILPEDDAKTLAARVLKLEHKLYPAVVSLLASQDIKLDNGELCVSDAVTLKSDKTVLIET